MSSEARCKEPGSQIQLVKSLVSEYYDQKPITLDILSGEEHYTSF